MTASPFDTANIFLLLGLRLLGVSGRPTAEPGLLLPPPELPLTTFCGFASITYPEYGRVSTFRKLVPLPLGRLPVFVLGGGRPEAGSGVMTALSCMRRVNSAVDKAAL